MSDNKYLSFEEYKEQKRPYDFLIRNKELAYFHYIQKTALYKDILLLYKDILNNFKKLICHMPINKIYPLSILYTYFLLPDGIFSIPSSITYEVEENIIEPKDIYGIKVFSGNVVCRHIVKMLIDIAQICNLEAYYICTKCIDSSDYHALLGLILDNEKVVLDPTNFRIGTFVKNNTENNIFLVDPFYQKDHTFYKLCFDNYEDIEYQKKMNYLKINQFYKKNSKMKIPFDDQYLFVKQLYDEYQLDFESFKKENIDNYQLINKMYHEISSYFSK